MIKTLQRRFILISMLSTFLVLAVIMGTINILNYQKVIADADHVLSFLSVNNGSFPEEFGPGSIQPKHPPKPLYSRNFRMSPEMPYETRYFSVFLASDGTVRSINTSKIAAVDADKASQYAAQIWNSKKTSGFLSQYRYRMEPCTDGFRLLCLDCGRSLDTFRAFLLTSLSCSLLGLCSVWILVIFFSRLVMRPIAESYDKQRQFITDAGHEIKTPLTIINSNLEILEMECGETEWGLAIQKQTARLAGLTSNLIYLSRMEETAHKLQKITFSLSDLVEEAVQSFHAPAATQNKVISFAIAPLISYYGDEASIQQLITILIDNAVKYSPPQGLIEVSLEKRGKNICFMVSNTAKQLSEENIPHLFDRFYRADASRNSETGGYGIGLSIALAVTRAHKGKISAKIGDQNSLTITVIL